MGLRVFVDTGPLLLAYRTAPLTERILKARELVLLNPDEHEFVGSKFLELELLPKADYFGHVEEAAGYREYFRRCIRTKLTYPKIVNHAWYLGVLYGMAAMDSLHMSVAQHARCDVFVTTENETKALYRAKGISIVHIDDLPLR